MFSMENSALEYVMLSGARYRERYRMLLLNVSENLL